MPFARGGFIFSAPKIAAYQKTIGVFIGIGIGVDITGEETDPGAGTDFHALPRAPKLAKTKAHERLAQTSETITLCLDIND
jgi:hypothetical protein